MIRFNKERFVKACNEVLDDIDDGKVSSKAWLWMASGAIVGLLSSCLSLKRFSGKPILASFMKLKKGRF